MNLKKGESVNLSHYMVVDYIRVRKENKKQIQKLLDNYQQQKRQFILMLSVLGIVVLVAVIGLLMR